MKTNTVTKLPKMAFGLGIGLLLAVVTMSSFKTSKRDSDLYGKTANGWELVRAGYSCTGEEGVCTATFDSQPDPDAIPDSYAPGAFVNGPN